MEKILPRKKTIWKRFYIEKILYKEEISKNIQTKKRLNEKMIT